MRDRNQFLNALLNFSIAAVIMSVGFLVGTIMSATPISAAGNTIGYVDIDTLLEKHPGWDAVMKKINAYEEKELQKLEKYSSKEKLTQAEKKESLDLAIQIRDNIQAKRKELSKPLYDDILKKAKEIGRQSGVEVVLDGAIVLYGGLDLTPMVYDQLEKNI